MRPVLFVLLALAGCELGGSATIIGTDDPGGDTDVVDTDASPDDTDDTTPDDTDDTSPNDTDDTQDTDPGDDTDPVVLEYCANGADLAALADAADTLEETIQECTFDCIRSRNLRICVADCMEAEVGLSGDCATCFGNVTQCVTNRCLRECFDPQSPDCATCRETQCEPAFERCSGIPIP